MAVNLNPHKYSTDPNTNAPILTRVQPYVRIRSGEGPPLFLQAGNIYYENGPAIPQSEWPDWVIPAIERLGSVSLEESGFQDFVQSLNAPDAPPKQLPPKTPNGVKK